MNLEDKTHSLAYPVLLLPYFFTPLRLPLCKTNCCVAVDQLVEIRPDALRIPPTLGIVV